MKEYGTTHVFFQELIFRLTAKTAEQMGLKFIMTRSEGAAGYMADGYARVSGRPGVCMAQSIGASNLAGGITDAWLSNTPVIAITGKKLPQYQYKNAYQEYDHRALFDSLTKFNAELQDPAQLPFLFRQAYREAVTGKPRPVHLDVPGFYGIETETAEISESFYAEPVYGKYPALRTPAEDRLVKEAAVWIESAEKPLIVAGRGANVSGAGEAIYKLAALCDIPVATSPDGKTVIDETDPLWAGVIGGYGMDCANKAARAADLVIFVGTQASDQTTCDWTAPDMATKVVQIDIEGSELGKNYPNSVGLLGDARTVVDQLSGAVREKKRPQWRKQVEALVQHTLSRQEKNTDASATPIRTEYLCKVMSEVLPDNAVLVSDTGWSTVWPATMIRMKKNQRYLRAAGTMGWGFPASLGAKCGAPDRPVVCFSGDGAFLYHLCEMETAMRYGINTVTVINNNRTFAQCVPIMRDMYPEDPDVGIRKLDIYPVNFANVAREFGLFALPVEKPEDIAPALRQALEAGKPALVEVLTAGPHVSVPLSADSMMTGE